MRKKKKTWEETLAGTIILDEDYSLERIVYQSPKNGDDIIIDYDTDYILISVRGSDNIVEELFIPVNIERYFISKGLLEDKGIINGEEVLREIEYLFPRTSYMTCDSYNKAM